MYRGYRGVVLNNRGQRGRIGLAPMYNYRPSRPFRGRRPWRRTAVLWRPQHFSDDGIGGNITADQTAASDNRETDSIACELARCELSSGKAPMAPKVTITSSGLDSTRRSSVPAPKPPPYHIDVVFQLLVVGEEKWEETCTKMREHIGKLSEQEKGFIDISSKQITGFALQSEQGAIRAAKVVRFLQDEIPTVFNFACLKRCIGYFLPRPRTDFHYSRLTKDQMLNFGVFLVWLYHHFEQTTFRDGIRGCLYTLLDYMAVDRSEMGVTRFRYVLSLCGGAAQGREPPMSHNHGPQGHKEGELQNEQKGAAEEQPKAEPSAQQSEMPGLQAEVGGQEEVADIPRFREIRRGGRRRPYNRGVI